MRERDEEIQTLKDEIRRLDSLKARLESIIGEHCSCNQHEMRPDCRVRAALNLAKKGYTMKKSELIDGMIFVFCILVLIVAFSIR